jgi:CelD/BcsL family acetyltransferase involved in cellulose biosynthesis
MGIEISGTNASAAAGAKTARTVFGQQLDPAASALSKVATIGSAERSTDNSTLKVVVVKNEEELRDHASAWQDLADHAMESNAFYEPWMLMSAVKTLGQGKSLHFIFIYEANTHGPAGTARLQGFFPVELLLRFRGLPIRTVRLWQHLHCFLCTPLVRAEQAGKTLRALLEWAANGPRAALVDFSLVAGDGPFQRFLTKHTDETGSLARVTSSTTRALWKRGDDIEVYLRRALSGGVLKEYRRQRRRLGEIGKLEFNSLLHGDGVDDWIMDFMRLEASGWKAREGTALQTNANQRAYVKEVVQNGFARGQALLHGLFLDGQPVAMLFSFRAGAGIFTFKIAYDETFAKYSPGVQVMLGVLGHLHHDSRFAWIDSCAESDHAMVNRLFRDRRTINTVLLSTGRLAGDLTVWAYPAGKWLKQLVHKKSNQSRSNGASCAPR